MPRHSPYAITLGRHEREILERRARKYTLPYFQVIRAQMILLAAEGRSNDEIAAALSIGRDVVSLWRKRFFYERVPGLEERPRPGRPRAFPPEVVVQVKALACELPTTLGVPLSRLSTADIVREVQRQGIVASISTRPFGDGCTMMRSVPGNTVPGSFRATPTSPRKPDGFWTCTPAAGTVTR